MKEHIKAQELACREAQAPLFAPKDGLCFKCGANIYKDMSVEKASKEVITSCPYCHKSFVE